MLQIIRKLLANSPFQNYGISTRTITSYGRSVGSRGKICEASQLVTNNVKFTYEEFYMLLTQVEAVLNSRPLTPLLDSPVDLEPLTIGHFIIGEAIVAIPEKNAHELGKCNVSRYHCLQQILRHFWSLWSKKYLNLLQQRTKWRFQKEFSIIEGALVMLKEEGTPPSLWPMEGSRSYTLVVMVLCECVANLLVPI